MAGRPSYVHGRVTGGTYISKIVINLAAHLSYPPLDYIAKALVIDVVVLSSDGALGTFLELVLAVTVGSVAQRP